MHYSLIREQLIDELGGDPEEMFEQFETEAIAAASLGQVHRARLKSGERVALKIQYPGIARTIRADMRNLAAIFAPLRLTKDWASFKRQFDEVRSLLDHETDYEHEAVNLREARQLFGEDDGIVLSVSDQGSGVPEADRLRVWERFWRGRSTNGVTGTGIGLAGAKEIVVLHGGEIRVEDAPGGGARFVVRLPRAAP